MRHRLVDFALIAGLVAVAGGIMWTLFNLGGSQQTPSPPAAAPTAPAAPTTPDTPSLPSPPGSNVVVVGPDDVAAPDGTVAPVAPDTPTAPTTPTTPTTPSAPADGTAPTQPAAPTGEPLPPEAGRTVPAAEAAPVPSGTVGLERVGFSYVTGGAGACGITLEPWQHIAVSRELLDAWGCGAEVTVTLDQPADGRDSFVAVVADTMNPQFSRTANVYVGTDEDAFAYGLMTGSITPVE